MLFMVGAHSAPTTAGNASQHIRSALASARVQCAATRKITNDRRSFGRSGGFVGQDGRRITDPSNPF
jgi:hypothetical protein